MIKNKTWILALTGAALIAALQAHGQTPTYAADDLILNFRNPAATTGNDLEVNLGAVTDLASGEVASSTLVEGVFGTIGTGVGDVTVGLSATAADAAGTTGTLWLTRVDTTPGTAPTTVSGQQSFSPQNLTAQRIGNIGLGYNSGTVVTGFNNATTVAGGNTDSYQTQGQESVSQTGRIDFGLNQNINASKGGNIETVQNGSADVYEALWEVPVSGTADTYEGYFTFQPNGEVDFTSVSSVPEPSTYALLLSTGLGALAMRRKLRW